MKDMFDLSGKTAIITGGNGGIGLGIARGLASQGANLVIAARNNDKTEKAVNALKDDFGVESLGLECDVEHEEQIKNMTAQSMDRFGRIDILVNNAGIAITKAPQDYTVEEWDKVININQRSVLLCSKAVYPIMKEAGGGKIICIGSMYSIFGGSGAVVYGSSKGGVVQLMRGLAVAWAPDNIQVNAILPGWIATDMVNPLVEHVPGFGDNLLSRTPAGRLGQGDDMAGAAAFLAGSASDFVTGVALPVDGGWAISG